MMLGRIKYLFLFVMTVMCLDVMAMDSPDLRDRAECSGRSASGDLQKIASIKNQSLKVISGSYLAQAVSQRYGIEISFTHEMPEIAIGRHYFHILALYIRAPSEHQVEGRFFPGELQIVLNDTRLRPVRVLSILLSEGQENTVIQRILRSVPAVGARVPTLTLAGADLRRVFPQIHTYYQFTGSMSVPPCANNLIWMVLTHPIQISHYQIQSLRQLYKRAH